MPTWFTGLFSGGFLNPGVAALGTLLISVPIVIHLINRLRYKKVEFAAMQFLLESEQQNRRRVLIEQLLLLLLRILAVVLATMLIGRAVFDASQLSVLRGGVSNQIVLLDDSMSTADRSTGLSAFDRAREATSRLIRAAADAPTQQRITVIRLTAPSATPPTLTEQVVDSRTADEMIVALDRLQPSAMAGDWQRAIEAVANRIGSADAGEKTTLIVVTDSREKDWAGATGIASQLEQLDAQGVLVNLVRTTKTASDNLAVTGLETTGATTAVGVPMRLRATVSNLSGSPAIGVRGTVEVDGQALPQALVIDSIEPGQTASQSFDVVFDSAGSHRVKVVLPSDALDTDNERFVALDVPEAVGVLLVDGDPAGTEAQYIADALAADRTLTGFDPLIIGPAELSRTALDRFQGIYLINVGDLPNDVIAELNQYVSRGGGIVSFVGPATRAEFVNDRLVPSGLFPVPISATPSELPDNSDAPDIVATNHPIFTILAGTDNPFLDQVSIRQYIPIADGAEPQTEGAKVIASLRNGAPLVYEHIIGAGRVITILTSAGPGELDDRGQSTWNNWARSPSFPVLVLELQAYVTAGENSAAAATVGEPMVFSLDPTIYREKIEITAPDGNVVGLNATSAGEGSGRTLEARFDETATPGVYRIAIDQAAGDPEVITRAFNVDPEESDLAVADENAIRSSLAGVSSLTLRDGTELGWIEAAASGSSSRPLLIGLLLLLLVIEQWWASRLSYSAT